MKLGDDPGPANPYLNHTLHEFGHALGLAHEHQRSDSDRSCAEFDAWCKINGCGITDGLLTPYDKASVMHYKFCSINGNYDNTGLSLFDQLGVHILYPEDQQVAEFVGTTVIRTTDILSLESAWEFRGANIGVVADSHVWQLNSKTVSSTPELSYRISSAGTYTLEFNHNDFLGRSYSYTGLVRVLSPLDYTNLIAGPIAAQLPLF
jgi:Astacin (Peptidase family M12A)